MANKKDKTEENIVKVEKNNAGKTKRSDSKLFIGIVLIMIGSLIFVNNFYPSVQVGQYFFPITLIIIGLMLIFRSF